MEAYKVPVNTLWPFVFLRAEGRKERQDGRGRIGREGGSERKGKEGRKARVLGRARVASLN